MSIKENRIEQLKELGFEPTDKGAYRKGNFKIRYSTIAKFSDEMWENLLKPFTR